MTLKYDGELLRIMKLFEQVTRVPIKEVVTFKNTLTFIVKEGFLGKALGRGKENLNKLTGLMNRKIKIVEFNPSVLQFVINLISPLKVVDIKQEDEMIIITGPDTKTKGLMIGAGGQNLRELEKIVQRHFPVKEIKVI